MKATQATFTTILALLSLVVGPVASAGTGNAAGYFVVRDGSCTLATAGDICANNFNLPSKTLVGDTSVISFNLNCDDDGSGVNFDINVLLNGVSVRSLHLTTGVARVLQEAVGGGTLVAGSNLLQIEASGRDDGNCSTSDVVLMYRLSTVP